MSTAGRNTVAWRLCLVLDALLDARGPATFAQLQAATGIDRRTLYRYLAALEECNLVERGLQGTTLGARLRSESVDVEVVA